jgi:hypothetical protein
MSDGIDYEKLRGSDGFYFKGWKKGCFEGLIIGFLTGIGIGIIVMGLLWLCL